MKLRIKYNEYLSEVFSFYAFNHPKTKDKIGDFKPATPEEMTKKAAEFQNAWEAIAESVINAIEKCTGRKNTYSKLDISVVPILHRSYSTPVIIPAYFSIDQFLKTIIHEIIHKIGYTLSDTFLEKYKNETKTVRDHIGVHAILTYIYIDVLNRPDLLELNKESSKKHSTNEYLRAWEIVETENYERILVDHIIR